MLREQLATAVDVLARQYINKKAVRYYGVDPVSGKTLEDPLEGPIIDPITLMGSSMLDELLRGQLREIIRDEINNHDR